MALNSKITSSLLKAIKNADNPHEEIPESVMRINHKILNSNGKLVLGIIYTMFIEGNPFKMGNAYIAKKTGLSRRIISSNISKLNRQGWIKSYIKEKTPAGSRREITAINLTRLFNIQSDTELFANVAVVRKLFLKANKLNYIGVNRDNNNVHGDSRNQYTPELEKVNPRDKKRKQSSHQKVGNNKVVKITSRERQTEMPDTKIRKSQNNDKNLRSLPNYKSASKLANNYNYYINNYNEKELTKIFSYWLQYYTKRQISRILIKTIDKLDVARPIDYAEASLHNHYISRPIIHNLRRLICGIMNAVSAWVSPRKKNTLCSLVWGLSKEAILISNSQNICLILAQLPKYIKDKGINPSEFLKVYISSFNGEYIEKDSLNGLTPNDSFNRIADYCVFNKLLLT